MLYPGHWVEIRQPNEILATLDAAGTLEGLPFMPEMLRHCGQRRQVLLCGERTCVHPPQMPFRRLEDCLVLEGLRCDGSAHAGCQLGCMMFWREAWLKPVEGPGTEPPPQPPPAAGTLSVHPGPDPEVFFCQATELPRISRAGVPIWRPGQYLGFLRRRTFSAFELAAVFLRMVRGFLQRRVTRFRLRGKPPLPGEGPLGLVPGQWVEVKSHIEILRTLDASGKHKGMTFAGEMADFCGRFLRVQDRVERIMDEGRGRIREVRDTVILENAICDRYLGCARNMPFLWREAWLRPCPPRVRSGDGPGAGRS